MVILFGFLLITWHGEAYALDEWLPRAINSEKPDCSQLGGDSDGDGICDHWEMWGSEGLKPLKQQSDGTWIPWREGVTWSIPCTIYWGEVVCPNPTIKDIYVEIDYMDGHYPDVAALEQVRQAFAAYDPPIQLHYHIDEKVLSHSPTTRFPGFNTQSTWGFDQIKQCRFGTLEERGKVDEPGTSGHNPCGWGSTNEKDPNRITKKAIFHYALYVHAQAGKITSSGIAEVFGNDFMISLGSYSGGVGSTDEQAGTFMHELGHNLRLNHGGSEFDTINCKPNHLSVMSYARQFSDLVSDRALDYSRAKINRMNDGQPLVEDRLSEGLGVARYVDESQRIVYGPIPPLVLPTTGVPIDWNLDGYIQEGTVQANLNYLTPHCPTSSSTETHGGHDDWAVLNLRFTESGSSFSDGVSGIRKVAGTPFPYKSPSWNFWSVEKDIAIESIADEITKEAVVGHRILRITSLECFLNLDVPECNRGSHMQTEILRQEYVELAKPLQIERDDGNIVTGSSNTEHANKDDKKSIPMRMTDTEIYTSTDPEQIQQIKNEMLAKTNNIKAEIEKSFNTDEGLKAAIKEIKALQAELQGVLREEPHHAVVIGTDDIIRSFDKALDYKPTNLHDGLSSSDIPPFKDNPGPEGTDWVLTLLITTAILIVSTQVIIYSVKPARAHV